MQVFCINNSAHLVFTRSSGNPSNVPIIPAASPTVNIEATSSTSMLVDNALALTYCGVRTWWKIEAETERTSDRFFSQIERHRLTNEHRRWLWLCQSSMICALRLRSIILWYLPLPSPKHSIPLTSASSMEWVVVVSGTDVFMWRTIACMHHLGACSGAASLAFPPKQYV